MALNNQVVVISPRRIIIRGFQRDGYKAFIRNRVGFILKNPGSRERRRRRPILPPAASHRQRHQRASADYCQDKLENHPKHKAPPCRHWMSATCHSHPDPYQRTRGHGWRSPMPKRTPSAHRGQTANLDDCDGLSIPRHPLTLNPQICYNTPAHHPAGQRNE